MADPDVSSGKRVIPIKPVADSPVATVSLYASEAKIYPRAVHGLFARWVKEFAADSNPHSQRFYRFINEVPTVLMIAIVILVVLKPF